MTTKSPLMQPCTGYLDWGSTPFLCQVLPIVLNKQAPFVCVLDIDTQFWCSCKNSFLFWSAIIIHATFSRHLLIHIYSTAKKNSVENLIVFFGSRNLIQVKKFKKYKSQDSKDTQYLFIRNDGEFSQVKFCYIILPVSYIFRKPPRIFPLFFLKLLKISLTFLVRRY